MGDEKEEQKRGHDGRQKEKSEGGLRRSELGVSVLAASRGFRPLVVGGRPKTRE